MRLAAKFFAAGALSSSAHYNIMLCCIMLYMSGCVMLYFIMLEVDIYIYIYITCTASHAIAYLAFLRASYVDTSRISLAFAALRRLQRLQARWIRSAALEPPAQGPTADRATGATAEAAVRSSSGRMASPDPQGKSSSWHQFHLRFTSLVAFRRPVLSGFQGILGLKEI